MQTEKLESDRERERARCGWVGGWCVCVLGAGEGTGSRYKALYQGSEHAPV